MKATLGPEHTVLGVMPSEVVALWNSLKEHYVTDLEIHLDPVLSDEGRAVLRVGIYSQRYSDRYPRGYMHCWALHDFIAMGYSITPSKLFDLLIDARDSIVRVLVDDSTILPTQQGE